MVTSSLDKDYRGFFDIRLFPLLAKRLNVQMMNVIHNF